MELALSIWGAALATALAALEVWKWTHDRPAIRVEAQFVVRPLGDQDRDRAKGTPLEVKGRGLQEVLLSFTVANHGRRSIQIVGVFVGDEKRLIQVAPNPLPALLEPGTRITALVQKEVLDLAGATASECGVIDALGRKHRIPGRMLGELLERTRAYPTRVQTYVKKEGISADVPSPVRAFQAHDEMLITTAENR